MRRFWRLVVALAALTAASLLAPARANSETPNAEARTEWASILRELANDPAVARFYRACPAAVAATMADRPTPVSATFTTDLCFAKPRLCLDFCRARHDARACFNFALAAQMSEAEQQPRVSESFFARACAMGAAAGCTNRGAGIRNGEHDDDPFRNLGVAARACSFKAFRHACAHDDAWGCAMLGQAYQNGEGVYRNLVGAVASYGKSCRLASRFAACDFAKRNAREGGLPPP